MADRRIFVIGGLVFDILFKLSRPLQTHDTIYADDLRLTPGGKGLNQTVAIKRLGGEVFPVACTGVDLFGDEIDRTLSREGISTEFVTRHSTAPTTVIGILVQEGFPSFVSAPRASRQITLEQIAAAIEQMDQNSILLANYEATQPKIRYSLQLAKARGATTIINPAPIERLEQEADLALIDYLIPNLLEAQYLLQTGETDPLLLARGLLAKGVKNVCITLGEQGSLFANDAVVLEQRAIAVNAIDTTGASDAFIAAFTVGVAQGWPVERVLRFAAAAGALACTVFGTLDAMPLLADVEFLLKTEASA